MESDGNPDAFAGQGAAGGDDNSGQDDEDGVTLLTNLIAASTETIGSVSVISSEPGMLNGWIDFDQSGDWNAGEQIFADVDLQAGINRLSFLVARWCPGRWYWRSVFGSNSQGGLAPTGPASDGEVEDYFLQIDDANGNHVQIDQIPPGLVTVRENLGQIVV